MTGNKEFGEHIRMLREARRDTDSSFSLRQFARAVGISPTFLSKIENGEFAPPAADKIICMARLLDVNADELLAMAGKVDLELLDIIRAKPRVLADFLRMVKQHNLSEADVAAITDMLRALKQRA